MQLEPTTLDTINKWLNGSYDETTKAEIQDLLDRNETTALTDAFYRDLEFGTGGLRGIMGAGSNRINKYTIGTATQGLSNYLLHMIAATTRMYSPKLLQMYSLQMASTFTSSKH
jgi:phosphoglucomutase